jgi:hypothetical protein
MKSNQILILCAIVFFGSFVLFSFSDKQATKRVTFEYKQMTTIESVVPAGLGRSRLLMEKEGGGESIEKMKNFYSVTGINFSNIIKNDTQISQKLGEMASQGWELDKVTSAVESTETSTGIFITRYFFKRMKE